MKNYTPYFFGFISFLFLQFSNSQITFGQWHWCGGPNGAGIQMLCSDGSYLYSYSYWDLFKVSSDNGATWVSPAAGGLPSNYYISSFTASGGVLYAGANAGGSGNGDLYVSYDHAATFTDLNNGYVFPAPHCIAVNGNQYFLSNSNGVEYSGDGGMIWSLVNTGLDNIDVKDLLIMGSTVLAATSTGVFVTSNNGASWSLSSLHHSIVSFATDGTNIYAAGDGVYKSSNNGSSWNQVTTGLPGNFNCSKIILSNGNAFVCDYINYGVYVTSVSSINWQEANAGLFNTMVSELTSQGSDIYCGSYVAISKSVNNGSYWSPVSNGLKTITVSSMAVDSTTLYVGTEYAGIFRSDNYGNTWLPIDSGLPQNLNYITCLSANNNIVFAGSFDDGLYRSLNAGVKWTHVFNGIDYCYTQAVAMVDSNIFMGTSDSGVYVSHDWGGSWVRMNYGLPGYNITSLTVNDTVVYAAVSGSGIFRSFDYGNSWNIFNTGLISLYCTQLASGGNNVYAAAGGKIYGASNGINTWTYLYGPISAQVTGLFDEDIQFIGAQNNTVFGVPEYYGYADEKFTVHSYDAGLTWTLDTIGFEPETTLCIIPMGNTAFIGAGENSVWCYNSATTGVSSFPLNLQANVFPNPSSGIFNFELSEMTSGNIIITNLLNQQVFNRPIDASEKKFKVDLENLPGGIYLYEIRQGSHHSSGKIILERP